MGTHSSILARRIPWTEEPGGLQSMGSQRVRHNEQLTHTHTTNHHHKYFKWASLVAQLVKNLPACNAGDLGLIPGSGRSPGEENGNPLQYSCLENPMDRGAWQATVHEVARVMRLLRHDLATKPPPILMARAVPTM